MKQKFKLGLGIFFCGAITVSRLRATLSTGKTLNLVVAAVFLWLTIRLILKWIEWNGKAVPKIKTRSVMSRPEQPQPVKQQTPVAEVYTHRVDPDENVTANGAPFSYLDARALSFWDQRTTEYKIPSYYDNSAFGRNVLPALKRLLDEGYLDFAPLEKSIALKKVPDLKAILAERELKTSGNKADLIHRLMDNIPEDELMEMFPTRVYEITPKGAEALDYYSIIFANGIYNLSFSFYRLLKEKEANPNLSDEEILFQMLLKDIEKADKSGKQEAYRVAAEQTARFLADTGQPEKAFDFYCVSFFMFWYRNNVEFGLEGPVEAYGYPAKSIERCGQLCNYSLQETLKKFRESLQEINPFGLSTKRNIDLVIKAFRDALSV